MSVLVYRSRPVQISKYFDPDNPFNIRSAFCLRIVDTSSLYTDKQVFRKLCLQRKFAKQSETK